jgi:CubicO group peptidase (beta-lactamase class C family)
MRVTLWVALVAVAGMLAFKPLSGVSPWALPEIPVMAAGLGAKLGCSHRFISGIDAKQVMADLESYSPAYGWLDLHYDDVAKTARADFASLGSATATFRPGLGCTLDIGDTSPLNGVTVPPLMSGDSPWPSGSRVQTIKPGVQEALDAMLTADNEEGYQTRALLLVRDGEIIAESYANGFGADTPLLGWSMGKTLTAMLFGTLEYQQLASPGESRLFSAWDGDDRSGITLEALLRMSSGLAFDETYAPGSDATRMLFLSHSASSVPLVQPLVHPPGTYFAYSSGTTNMLSKLFIERVGGSLQHGVDYLHREFLAPLSLAHTILEPDPGGVFVGSSYIYATARDWARMGQLLLAGGELNGRRLFSGDWVERAVRPNSSGNDPRYGYQLWLNSGGSEPRWAGLPADAYAMLGNRSQVVMMVPSAGAIIVRLGWSAADYPVAQKFGAILSL